jgi:hypothetical protein
MKTLAIVAGIAFLLAGIACFAGLITMLPMYGIVLVVAGALFIMYGVTGRRTIVPPARSGRDMRDMGGV